MFDTKTIDDMANKLAGVLPPALHTIKEDLEKLFALFCKAYWAKWN